MNTPAQGAVDQSAQHLDLEAELAELGRRRKTAMFRLRYLGTAIERAAVGAAQSAGVPDRVFSDDMSAVLHLRDAAAAAEKK
jgi:hypothetical protein